MEKIILKFTDWESQYDGMFKHLYVNFSGLPGLNISIYNLIQIYHFNNEDFLRLNIYGQKLSFLNKIYIKTYFSNSRDSSQHHILPFKVCEIKAAKEHIDNFLIKINLLKSFV